MEQLDPQVVALAKSIRQVESGGDFKALGKSGEIGAYQFLPTTFAEYSRKHLGQSIPLEKSTPEQQNEVAYRQIKEWKDKGLNPGQIASSWNAGPGEPDAYLGKFSNGKPAVGKNEFGADYDVPKYAKMVAELYQQEKGIPASQMPQTEFAPIYQEGQQTQVTPEGEPSLGQELKGRAGDAGTAIKQSFTGEINPLRGLLRTAGAGFGAVGDVAGAAIGLIPGVKQAEEYIGNKIAGSETVKDAVGGYAEFAQKHPELAKDISAVGNIATGLPVVKGVSGVLKAGSKGVKKALGTELNKTIDAISPEFSGGSVGGAQNVKKVGTNVSTISGKVSRNVDPEMKEAAKVIHEVAPEFDDLKTYSQKYDAVDTGIGTLANQLRTNLAKQEIQPILTFADMQTLQKNMIKEIAENPLLVGDAGQIAERIFNQFKNYLPDLGKKDVLMTDILDARQKLDTWIRNLKGASPFDPKTENALSVSLRAVRQGANNLMEKRVPSAQVKKLLRKQSLLYRATDNLTKKVSKEVGSTRMSRFVGRHPIATSAINNTLKFGLGGAGVGTGSVLLEKWLRD